MPNYRAMTRRAALRYGLDPRIFVRQINAESGFDEDVITGRRASGAGALGIAQIMPETARGWGVDPLNPKAALNAAAKNMAKYVRAYGSYENALRAYNAGPGAIEASKGYAETNAYVNKILHGSDPGRLGTPTGGGGGTTSSTVVSPGGAVNVAQVLSALRAQEPARPQAAGPPAPSFSAAPALPEGYQAPETTGSPIAKRDYGAALRAVSAAAAADATGTPTGAGTSPGTTEIVAGGGKLGTVAVRPGANRAGVPIQKPVIQFVRQVAGLYGKPLTIGTGTAHDRLTINGTVSDHWRGAGADIPLAGNSLVQAGRAALIAAGMPAKKANKINGGGFNVGGWQVIFNTNAPGWGDHTDHLHVGRKG